MSSQNNVRVPLSALTREQLIETAANYQGRLEEIEKVEATKKKEERYNIIATIMMCVVFLPISFLLYLFKSYEKAALILTIFLFLYASGIAFFTFIKFANKWISVGVMIVGVICIFLGRGSLVPEDILPPLKTYFRTNILKEESSVKKDTTNIIKKDTIYIKSKKGISN